MKTFSFMLFVLLLFAPSSARAQIYAIDAGSILIDGQASIISTGVEDVDDRQTSIFVNPSAQYFFAPGLAIGGEALVNRISSGGDSFTTYGIGPALSYYFGQPDSEAFPFVSGSIFFTDTSEDGGSGTAFRLSGGAVYMLARNIGLTGEVFYLKQNLESQRDFDQFGASFGIAAFLF